MYKASTGLLNKLSLSGRRWSSCTYFNLMTRTNLKINILNSLRYHSNIKHSSGIWVPIKCGTKRNQRKRNEINEMETKSTKTKRNRLVYEENERKKIKDKTK